MADDMDDLLSEEDSGADFSHSDPEAADADPRDKPRTKLTGIGGFLTSQKGEVGKGAVATSDSEVDGLGDEVAAETDIPTPKVVKAESTKDVVQPKRPPLTEEDLEIIAVGGYNSGLRLNSDGSVDVSHISEKLEKTNALNLKPEVPAPAKDLHFGRSARKDVQQFHKEEKTKEPARPSYVPSNLEDLEEQAEQLTSRMKMLWRLESGGFRAALYEALFFNFKSKKSAMEMLDSFEDAPGIALVLTGTHEGKNFNILFNKTTGTVRFKFEGDELLYLVYEFKENKWLVSGFKAWTSKDAEATNMVFINKSGERFCTCSNRDCPHSKIVELWLSLGNPMIKQDCVIYDSVHKIKPSLSSGIPVSLDEIENKKK